MFKCIAEGFKKRHLKKMVVKDERVLSFYNLDTAKKCIVFWVTDDVPVFSVNRVREALAKHMDVCLLAFIRQPKLNSEQILFTWIALEFLTGGDFVILGCRKY